MTKRFIVVAGNIGSGKTSITERIGVRLGWRTAFESVANNPYLPEFYADMRQWSFHLQVFFWDVAPTSSTSPWRTARRRRFPTAAFTRMRTSFAHALLSPWAI